MILPIYAYGSKPLREVAEDFDESFEGVEQLIEGLFETMQISNGVGLAAPQVGRSLRMFVVDARIYADEEPSLKDFRKVFINAHVIEEDGDEELIQEGCLSVPGLHEEVLRPSRVRIQYLDDQLVPHDEWYDGMAARIIQHEYDHLDGILFPDRLTPFRKRLLKGKLRDIMTGKVDVRYRMIFPNKK